MAGKVGEAGGVEERGAAGAQEPGALGQRVRVEVTTAATGELASAGMSRPAVLPQRGGADADVAVLGTAHQ